jgi:hypothetical protein
VQLRGFGSQFEHLAQHRDAPGGVRIGRDHFERTLHGERVGVVGIVEHRHAAGGAEHLPAMRRRRQRTSALD